MPNEEEAVAKPNSANVGQYVCHLCGGWQTLVGASVEFLPFIDHLIQHLCLMKHPKLSQRRIVGDQIWFLDPDTNEMIYGLLPYEPSSKEWKRLLEKREKILPQAKFFLLDIADWLAKALLSLEGLKSIVVSNLFAADQLVKLVQTLPPELHEQREYLLNHREKLEQTGMDPKWLGTPGRQAEFVSRSMAGARWGLSPSSSREMIRQIEREPREEVLQTLKIHGERGWWNRAGEA